MNEHIKATRLQLSEDKDSLEISFSPEKEGPTTMPSPDTQCPECRMKDGRHARDLLQIVNIIQSFTGLPADVGV